MALYYDAWEFFRRPNRELNKARVMEGYYTAAAVTRQTSSTQQLLMEQQHQRPTELISQDSREERLEQVSSKSSESDSISHSVSNAEKINPQIIVSVIPVELVRKIDLRRCESPPHALAPYLNSRELLRLVPEPKGPDCTTEFPVSSKTIETIRLHGRKESAVPPGEADFVSIVLVAQAELAVSPFKNHPKWQIKKEQSMIKKAQSIPMQRAQDKEKKEQLSLVPVDSNDISDSEDDFPHNDLPRSTPRSSHQSECFHRSVQPDPRTGAGVQTGICTIGGLRSYGYKWVRGRHHYALRWS